MIPTEVGGKNSEAVKITGARRDLFLMNAYAAEILEAATQEISEPSPTDQDPESVARMGELQDHLVDQSVTRQGKLEPFFESFCSEGAL